MKHSLKIWPIYFASVIDGTKTFEIRENDRGFQKGDSVELKEWEPNLIEKVVDSTPFGDDYAMVPEGYTGRKATAQIGYVLPIDEKRVVFSLV